ncbi:hypothetical protein M1D47_25225 [Bacillus sp. R1-10]
MIKSNMIFTSNYRGEFGIINFLGKIIEKSCIKKQEGNDVDTSCNSFVILWDLRVAGRNDEQVKLLQARGFKSADEKSIHVSGNPFSNVELSGKKPWDITIAFNN